MLKGNKVLTSLQLRSCVIGPEGLSGLCSGLKENTTLTKLDLSENRFDDDSIASLGKLLIVDTNHSSYDCISRGCFFLGTMFHMHGN